ncbi:MAG: hypothetical protein ACLPWS_21865 [Rhodomicrobium sp.]
MGFRLLLTIAALAAFGMTVESRADGAPAGYHSRAHRHTARHYRRYCCQPVGGHRYGETYSMPPMSDTNGYPGFYNNQTFWERVQTQRNYPVGY